MHKPVHVADNRRHLVMRRPAEEGCSEFVDAADVGPSLIGCHLCMLSCARGEVFFSIEARVKCACGLHDLPKRSLQWRERQMASLQPSKRLGWTFCREVMRREKSKREKQSLTMAWFLMINNSVHPRRDVHHHLLVA